MGEQHAGAVGGHRLWVRAHGDERVRCLVCGAVLVEPGEHPQLCEHVLYLFAEPEGPEAAHPGEQPRGDAKAFRAGVRDLASRPEWVRVPLLYEVDPDNGVWRMTLAWPIAALGGADVAEGIKEAIARFVEGVE